MPAAMARPAEATSPFADHRLAKTTPKQDQQLAQYSATGAAGGKHWIRNPEHASWFGPLRQTFDRLVMQWQTGSPIAVVQRTGGEARNYWMSATSDGRSLAVHAGKDGAKPQTVATVPLGHEIDAAIAAAADAQDWISDPEPIADLKSSPLLARLCQLEATVAEIVERLDEVRAALPSERAEDAVSGAEGRSEDQDPDERRRDRTGGKKRGPNKRQGQNRDRGTA